MYKMLIYILTIPIMCFLWVFTNNIIPTSVFQKDSAFIVRDTISKKSISINLKDEICWLDSFFYQTKKNGWEQTLKAAPEDIRNIKIIEVTLLSNIPLSVIESSSNQNISIEPTFKKDSIKAITYKFPLSWNDSLSNERINLLNQQIKNNFFVTLRSGYDNITFTKTAYRTSVNKILNNPLAQIFNTVILKKVDIDDKTLVYSQNCYDKKITYVFIEGVETLISEMKKESNSYTDNEFWESSFLLPLISDNMNHCIKEILSKDKKLNEYLECSFITKNGKIVGAIYCFDSEDIDKIPPEEILQINGIFKKNIIYPAQKKLNSYGYQQGFFYIK